MILLTHGEVQANGKAVVYGIHYMPETLTDEEKAGGLLVDSELPRPAEEKGYSWAHYVDPVTLVQSYEKVPRSLTQEEQLDDLKAENASLRQQVGQANADFTAFTDFYASKFPEQFL